MKTSVPGKDLQAEVGVIKSELSEMTNTINAVVGAVNTLSEAVTKTLAKNYVAAPARHLEADEMDMAPNSSGRVIETPTGPKIELAPGADLGDPVYAEKMKNLAFLEEFIEVDILSPIDDQMPYVFEISVSGQTQLFRHNTRAKVKRKFVEGLARAKPSSLGNEEQVNAKNGEKEYLYPERKTLKYPFSLVNASETDARWIRSIIAQP